jgi:hypothetical protein
MFAMTAQTHNLVNNALYLRRRGKVCLPSPEQAGGEPLPLHFIATVIKNVEPLGYTFSEPLIQACRQLALDQLTEFYRELTALLERTRGAHRRHRPMYPNFPQQVMRMLNAELYVNAILHYWTEGRYLPKTEVKKRLPLLDNVELTVIDLGSIEEFEGLFGQIAGSNTSLSEQDREDLAWFVKTYGEEIGRLLPERVSQKENVATLAALLVQHTESGVEFIARYCRTATDVLRLAAAMSGGDVSLAKPTKFRAFSRPERRLLLDLAERTPKPVEDMLRWQGRWIRLGEKLHPREMAKQYPKAAEAFHILRNDIPVITFGGAVEKALAAGNIGKAVACLAARPGDFARRLDHLLRMDAGEQETVLAAFVGVAGKAATPLLLQVRQHFLARNDAGALRVFFPKGNLAKAHAEENRLPEIPRDVCLRVAEICEEALVERFRALPPLGRCYLDEKLADYLVPFSQRSASRSARTLVRGSRIPMPEGCKVLRFFVWWRNGNERTDIDLSAAMFDEDFGYKDVVSYYNLVNYGGFHSGDIVDAPQGASEFIDISVDRTLEMGVRYVVMTLTSYTQQPYRELPECFAGWMARQHANSGEIYEPATVQDRLDITADTRIALPLVIDLLADRVIWCDMALRRNPHWENHVHGNLKGINLTLQALTETAKPSLHDLFALHVRARGERVETLEQAETVFSVESGTPFRLEEIASAYLV